MAKTKQKTQQPTFSQFAHACVFNQPVARRMLQDNPFRLTMANEVGETALADLVVENYLDAARFLLDAGADINTRDMSAATPLIQAAMLGYQEIVVLLLERGQRSTPAMKIKKQPYSRQYVTVTLRFAKPS